MKSLDLLAEKIVSNHRTVIVGGLLLTGLLGAGLFSVDLVTSHDEFVGDSATSRTNNYVERNFRTWPENTTTAKLVIQRTYHIVSARDIPKQLHYQQRLTEDERVAPTLADEQSLGISNVIAFVAIRANESDSGQERQVQGRPGGDIRSPDGVNPIPEPRPPLKEQHRRANDSSIRPDLRKYEKQAIWALNRDVGRPAGGVYAFVPKYYDTRFRPRAHATVIYIYQDANLSDSELLRSQRAMRELAHEEFEQARSIDEQFKVRVYGRGIVNDELNRSTIDSLQLVGPIGVMLSLGVLMYAYRDPLDVLFTLVGVALVLIWTFGFMGWIGIDFNQLFISTPLFLIGLSLDFAIHATMRYREERGVRGRFDPRVVFLGEDQDPGMGPSMRRGIGSVGVAFVLVTLTTGIGFLSSLSSPVQTIREFGFIAAFGIFVALVVFGAFVPSIKIEIDRWLESRGYDRRRQAFAGKEGRMRQLLEPPVQLAEHIPWLVVGIVALVTAAGLVGATTLDTSFDQKQLHVEDTPDWLDSLPAPLRPGEYHTYETLEFFRSSGFVNENNLAHILVRGDITDPATLERIDRGRQYAAESNTTLEFGRHTVREEEISSTTIRSTTGPLAAMRAVARTDDQFNETFHSSDTDGDGIPDRNLDGVYDALYRADQKTAETVIYREDGRYRALRLEIYTNRTKPTEEIASEVRRAASIVDSDHGTLTASATGQPVINADVQRELFVTGLRSFGLTLAIVFVLLVSFYWLTRNSMSLGVVTMLPVLCAVSWILGTMSVLGLQFNLMTILVASFTIGIGLDYSIHISERYVQELDQQSSVSQALRTSVYGTGGALLGSALTTTGGFAVLVFSILGPLQTFGAITAITVIYSFVGSVFVLPSLLVLWTKYLS